MSCAQRLARLNLTWDRIWQRTAVQLVSGLVLLTSLSPLHAQTYRLPDLGSSAETLLSSGAEVRLGQVFMRRVREALPVLDEPLLTDYIESLGQTLVSADRAASGRFTFL